MCICCRVRSTIILIVCTEKKKRERKKKEHKVKRRKRNTSKCTIHTTHRINWTLTTYGQRNRCIRQRSSCQQIVIFNENYQPVIFTIFLVRLWLCMKNDRFLLIINRTQWLRTALRILSFHHPILFDASLQSSVKMLHLHYHCNISNSIPSIRSLSNSRLQFWLPSIMINYIHYLLLRHHCQRISRCANVGFTADLSNISSNVTWCQRLKISSFSYCNEQNKKRQRFSSVSLFSTDTTTRALSLSVYKCFFFLLTGTHCTQWSCPIWAWFITFFLSIERVRM